MFKLLKAVYGLRDARRAWRIRLDRELKILGGVPLTTDRALYAFYSKSNSLEAVISAHVDDLKGTGIPSRTAEIIAGLEKAFGKMKTQEDSFIHCGLKHEKTQSGYIVHQDAYAQQLRCIDTSKLNLDKPDEPLDEEHVSKFMSLLGGLSWLIQTRADICVYVTALQRAATKATVAHVIKINKLTKWVRRKQCRLTYNRPTSHEFVLACISDSAFRTEPGSSVALRGAMIGTLFADNVFHPMEFFCRKQRRVCRSTFAAESNAFADAVEVARLINFTITHLHQPISPTKLAELEEHGQLPVQLHCFIDCKSLYDTLSASDLRTPSEASLVLIIASLRELLERQVIKTVTWIDTADMLSDGLTKGLVSRKALLHASNHGSWKPVKLYKSFSKERTAESTQSEDQTAMQEVFCQLRQRIIQNIQKYG